MKMINRWNRFFYRLWAPVYDATVGHFFLSDTSRLTLGRLLNLGSMLFGTDITRRFGDLARGANIKIVQDEPSLLHGMYRVILLTSS